jgi:hypothetical protein
MRVIRWRLPSWNDRDDLRWALLAVGSALKTGNIKKKRTIRNDPNRAGTIDLNLLQNQTISVRLIDNFIKI